VGKNKVLFGALFLPYNFIFSCFCSFSGYKQCQALTSISFKKIDRKPLLDRGTCVTGELGLQSTMISSVRISLPSRVCVCDGRRGYSTVIIVRCYCSTSPLSIQSYNIIQCTSATSLLIFVSSQSQLFLHKFSSRLPIFFGQFVLNKLSFLMNSAIFFGWLTVHVKLISTECKDLHCCC